MDSWGPQHQDDGRGRRKPTPWRWLVWVIVALALYGIHTGAAKHDSPQEIIGGLLVLAAIAAVGLPVTLKRWLLRPFRGSGKPDTSTSPRPTAADGDPLREMRHRAWHAGGGVHLGLHDNGRPRFSRAERAVLILGPPRSGKTTGVIIPTLVAHTGPVVSTSTKPDVLAATRHARSQAGRLWVFDPTGAATATRADGVTVLRWSPVTSATTWDGALLIARAMCSDIGAGVTESSHWANRAQALLAPMLHAAAIHNLDIATVAGWVMSHDLDQAGMLLEDERCSQMAFQSLLGLHNTERRERSSIFSATADALQAYTGEHAISASSDPNFDPAAFVRSHDTIYIHAPAERQAAVAPIVCGLLAEIRRATYQAHAQGQIAGRVLFALDEVANIAPLEELPQIASEGGGQGLLLMAALQDLSQARRRWGAQAEGFLTLFGTKLILPGIADTKTLEAVSTMLGEYDRQVVSHNQPHARFSDVVGGSNGSRPRSSTTYSTQRTRVLSAGEIANIPVGRALHLDGITWELLTLTPAHTHEPWRTLTTQPIAA